MALADFRLRLPLRVRWVEVDRQGVVFNGHYLTYCDVCVTEYWRAIGVRYPDDLVRDGTDIFVRHARLDYFAAAVYDDELLVCGRVARLGRSSMTFAIELVRERSTGAVLVAAELVYVNADPAQRKSVPWAEPVRARVLAYEVLPPLTADGPDGP